MAPHEVVGSPILARAIANFKLFLNDFKKIYYLCSLTYSFINWVTISLTVVFSFNAITRRLVRKSSSISITNCFISLMLITTLLSYITICKSSYKYIIIGI